mgnify:CR=1 FL=1
MNDFEKKIEALQQEIKKLTLMKGVGVESNQDGNVGTADAVTGTVDFEKMEKEAKKKMLVSKYSQE